MMNEEFISRLEAFNKDADCTPDDVEFLISDWRTLTTKLKDLEDKLKAANKTFKEIEKAITYESKEEAEKGKYSLPLETCILIKQAIFFTQIGELPTKGEV